MVSAEGRAEIGSECGKIKCIGWGKGLRHDRTDAPNKIE